MKGKEFCVVGCLGLMAGLGMRPQGESQSELSLVDEKGRVRMRLSSEPDPRLVLFSEVGTEVVALGLAKEGEFSAAAEGEAFLSLGAGGNKVVLGFTQLKDGADRGAVLLMSAASLDADRGAVVGTNAGISVAQDRANFVLGSFEPFPTPRAILGLDKDGPRLQLRDDKGAVTHTTGD